MGVGGNPEALLMPVLGMLSESLLIYSQTIILLSCLFRFTAGLLEVLSSRVLAIFVCVLYCH